MSLVVEMAAGIKIWIDADIGPGLYIGHFGNVFIGPIKMGKFCNVSQENSIGFAGRGEHFGVPEVGDFVYVAPGAKVVGKIRIGNHVAIGANAVVTKDVPDDAVVGGVPAKVISMESSRGLILYNREKNSGILAESE
jgi:serine O-acetyltransferase